MTKSFFVLACAALCCMACHQVVEHDHDHDHDHEAGHHDVAHEHEHDHGHEDEDAFVVVFTHEQREHIPFRLDTLSMQPFGRVVRTVARVAATPAGRQVVTARTAGIVHWSDGVYYAGSTVRQGQLLGTVSADGFVDDLSVRLIQAESEYQSAKKEFERHHELMAEHIVTENDYLRAETAYRQAEASYNALQRSFGNGVQRLQAARSGYVGEVTAPEGAYVEAGAQLMTVLSADRISLEAMVAPSDMDVLSRFASATLSLQTDNTVYDLADWNGKLCATGRSVTADSPLVQAVFEADNPLNLLPGQFVTMFLQADGGGDVLTVPNSALVEEMGSIFVFVQLTDETFEKRLVTCGATDGRVTVLTSGAAAGEVVVAEGAVMVKLSQASGALDAHSGHVH